MIRRSPNASKEVDSQVEVYSPTPSSLKDVSRQLTAASITLLENEILMAKLSQLRSSSSFPKWYNHTVGKKGNRDIREWVWIIISICTTADVILPLDLACKSDASFWWCHNLGVQRRWRPKLYHCAVNPCCSQVTFLTNKGNKLWG